MYWYTAIAVILAGFAAGFINTIAGSGSLITLPLLIFLGMPANVANGTNRLGILFQTITSTLSFRKHGYFQFRRGLIIAAPAVVGSLLGAMIAVDLNEDLMRKAIGILLLVMVVLILIKPEKWFGRQQENLFRMGFWQGIAVFFVGIYGGFIQAGVGFFLLGTLVLGIKTDLVSGNAYKNFTVLCLTISALVIFFANHQVRVLPGLLLAVGSIAGAWTASQVAVRKGARFIGWFLVAAILLSAGQLLGVFSRLGEVLAKLF